jgi:hypothetical protein
MKKTDHLIHKFLVSKGYTRFCDAYNGDFITFMYTNFGKTIDMKYLICDVRGFVLFRISHKLFLYTYHDDIDIKLDFNIYEDIKNILKKLNDNINI